MDDLTTRDLTPPETQYRIRNVLGYYFILWENFALKPSWTASQQAARKLSTEEADFILLKMEQQGIKAKKVKVK